MLTFARSRHACGIYHSSAHDGNPIIVISGGFGSQDTCEFWDFTVPGSKWILTSKNLPTYMFGAKMTTSGNGKGLLMTYEDKIYSFDCDSPTTCFWTEEETKLKIRRHTHLMFTVPTSLVEECYCQLN